VEQVVEAEEAEEVEEAEEAEEAVFNDSEKCKYNAIKGKAMINKFNFSNSDEVIVKFNFEKNDQDISIYPEVSSTDVVFAINGKNKYPSKYWCAENEIIKGATFNCVRYELIKDTGIGCAKVKYSMTDFEDSGL
jgi:hypothetical protein